MYLQYLPRLAPVKLIPAIAILKAVTSPPKMCLLFAVNCVIESSLKKT